MAVTAATARRRAYAGEHDLDAIGALLRRVYGPAALERVERCAGAVPTGSSSRGRGRRGGVQPPA